MDTVSPGTEKMSLAILDIKSAFLYGKARRKIAIELPPEDPRRDSGANVGLLNKSMYGTRDALMIWQDHFRGVLTAMGFKESLSVPCMFRHPETNVNIVVHVDDIFAVGDEADLKWLIEQLKKQYDLKNKIIGPNEHQCASYLGRVISFTSAGVMMEPDKKHVETLLKEAGMESCKSSPTPFIIENAILEHLPLSSPRTRFSSISEMNKEQAWNRAKVRRPLSSSRTRFSSIYPFHHRERDSRASQR